MMSDDMLKKIYEIADLKKTADDNLLKAIASIAANGHISIIPSPEIFTVNPKPIIMLPEGMYNRMMELFAPGNAARQVLCEKSV